MIISSDVEHGGFVVRGYPGVYGGIARQLGFQLLFVSLRDHVDNVRHSGRHHTRVMRSDSVTVVAIGAIVQRAEIWVSDTH